MEDLFGGSDIPPQLRALLGNLSFMQPANVPGRTCDLLR